MCRVIYANDDTIETMGELAGMIGGQERIVFNPGYQYKANVCLCGVDVRKTASSLGCKAIDVFGDWKWFGEGDQLTADSLRISR